MCVHVTWKRAWAGGELSARQQRGDKEASEAAAFMHVCNSCTAAAAAHRAAALTACGLAPEVCPGVAAAVFGRGQTVSLAHQAVRQDHIVLAAIAGHLRCHMPAAAGALRVQTPPPPCPPQCVIAVQSM